jgi:hypothetical protein
LLPKSTKTQKILEGETMESVANLNSMGLQELGITVAQADTIVSILSGKTHF